MCLNAACLAAGTKLWTPEGDRNVEDIQPGEYVYSRNEHDPLGAIEAKLVEEKFQRTGRILHLHLGDGILIRTTPEHPFFVQNQGWIPAGNLNPGDRVKTESTWTTVTDILDTGEYEIVYNVRVSDWHTYFVKEDAWPEGIWAHNIYFEHLANADQSLATLGKTYVLLSHQAFAQIPRKFQNATVAVTEATINGQRKFIFAVYGTNPAFRAVETFAHAMGAVAFHAQGYHAEEYLHVHYGNKPGFTGAIGHSNYHGTCPNCRTYFALVGFKNVWWSTESAL
jgi:hypothetical protein